MNIHEYNPMVQIIESSLWPLQILVFFRFYRFGLSHFKEQIVCVSYTALSNSDISCAFTAQRPRTFLLRLYSGQAWVTDERRGTASVGRVWGARRGWGAPTKICDPAHPESW